MYDGPLPVSPPPRSCRIWTLVEAQANLPEIFRLAEEEGPQHIGTPSKTYFVVSSYANRETVAPPIPLGQFLVQNLPGAGDLEHPDRKVRPRPIPLPEDETKQ